jgi:hypothetical protein
VDKILRGEAIRVEGEVDGIITMNQLPDPCHHHWQVAKLCGAIIFYRAGSDYILTLSKR